MAEDRMLSDEVLLALINKNSGGGGGGGGTNNYNDLSNQPQINGNTLIGNKTASDLGLVAAEAGKGLSSNDYTNEDKAIVGGVTAALADKQNELTAGSHITIDNDEISVQRWAVPAGKVVYTVITSDENYGQNVHVQRHTLGGTFIDDRVYFVQTWQTATVDDVISIKDTYGKFEITLLKNSDEQSAGYKYIVQPVTTPTSNSFTFLMEQEENGNDLIIRSELDTKQDKLTFDDTPTDNSNNPVKSNGIYDALALKQDKTDNSLQTTDKTVVGAVNELKSGLTNVQDDVKLNTQDLTTPSRTKNIMPVTIADIKSGNTTGTWTDNAYAINGITYTVNTNADGQITDITVSGTASANADLKLLSSFTITKQCILTGCPANGGSTRWYLGIQSYGSDNGNGLTVNANTYGQLYIRVASGIAITTPILFYPMLRYATITDPTFAPYIPSVDARLEAVESGLTSLGNKVFSAYGTQNADSWYKIGEYVLPEPNYIIHNFIIAIAGTQIKQVTLRCTPTGFNNDLTAVRQVYSDSKNFAIRLASTSKVELYAKVSLRGRHAYSIISEAGNADYKVTLSDPVASSYTDTDMYIVN